MATDAKFGVDLTGAGLGINADSSLRASVGTRNRVSALTARFLNHHAVAPNALRHGQTLRALRPEEHIAGDLDAGKSRRSLAFVELRAGKFTAMACHAQIGIGNQNALAVSSTM